MATAPDEAVYNPVLRLASDAWRDGEWRRVERTTAEEAPVALVYDGATEAVMMATPADLEDFALGFSLNEGLIATHADVRAMQIAPGVDGIEARIWLTQPRGAELSARRRTRAGPTGCGLCGVDSLAEANRMRSRIDSSIDFKLTAGEVQAAMASLDAAQPLGEATRAVHAAGFWTPALGLVAVREDVGRHNALDKLAGALARQGVAPAQGVVLLTSRVSVEMVQKVAAMGATVLIAISAPTALAIRTASAAGLTLIAVARRDGFEVFTVPRRILAEPIPHPKLHT